MKQILGWDDLKWRKTLILWLGLSLGLHLIAGWMSEGFYDLDEHFQVMEFLGYRLGRTPVSHLTPEFAERDRSWMQPSIYEVICRLWMFFGVVSPEIWARTIRIFSSLLGWLSLVGISLCSYGWFTGANAQAYRKWVLQLFALLYFIPYLQARTSSENLSSSFFFIGISLFLLFSVQTDFNKLRISYKQPSFLFSLFVGFLLGLSFSCRFQMGFMILGFGVWCLSVAQISFFQGLAMGFGFCAALGLEVVLDWRGYGVWTFAPWNYLNIALLQKKAESTGAFPWWYYFEYLRRDIPYFGNFLAALFLLGGLTHLSNPLTLSAFPFVLAHFGLAHKEPRYLFPLVPAVPILLVFGIKWLREDLQRFIPLDIQAKLKKYLPLCRKLGIVLFILNFCALGVATLKPAAVQPLLHHYIYRNHEKIKTLYYLGRDPFELIGYQLDFYKPLGLSILEKKTFSELSDDLYHNSGDLWFTFTHFELPAEAGILKDKCSLQFSVFPDWLKHFLFLPGIRLYSNKNSIFKCTWDLTADR